VHVAGYHSARYDLDTSLGAFSSISETTTFVSASASSREQLPRLHAKLSADDQHRMTERGWSSPHPSYAEQSATFHMPSDAESATSRGPASGPEASFQQDTGSNGASIYGHASVNIVLRNVFPIPTWHRQNPTPTRPESVQHGRILLVADSLAVNKPKHSESSEPDPRDMESNLHRYANRMTKARSPTSRADFPKAALARAKEAIDCLAQHTNRSQTAFQQGCFAKLIAVMQNVAFQGILGTAFGSDICVNFPDCTFETIRGYMVDALGHVGTVEAQSLLMRVLESLMLQGTFTATTDRELHIRESMTLQVLWSFVSIPDSQKISLNVLRCLLKITADHIPSAAFDTLETSMLTPELQPCFEKAPQVTDSLRPSFLFAVGALLGKMHQHSETADVADRLLVLLEQHVIYSSAENTQGTLVFLETPSPLFLTLLSIFDDSKCASRTGQRRSPAILAYSCYDCGCPLQF